MSNLVIFDLDGVLMDSKVLHYEVLNKALAKVNSKYVITEHEQEHSYEGKPTMTKLKILTAQKGLDPSTYDEIWKHKQLLTLQYIDNNVKTDNELIDLMKFLHENDNEIACASNSIYATVKKSLLKLGLTDHIDYFLSNEDITHPKPHPEIYYRCMIRSNKSPSQVTIIEDSPVGIEAAQRTGARVITVRNRSDVRKSLFIPVRNVMTYSCF
jgi:HAD superfamily hydrolase (TIGR01509 family)